jgi:hypothetical protein
LGGGSGGGGDIEGRLADIDKRLRAIEEMLHALLERSAGGARSSDVK